MKAASIIIPTFNRAHLVVRAIESAINQTYPCEVIVCDHGSTDSTPDVVARYRGKIRYIRREEDNGPIVCWRDGIEQATGEIIHINYDDDWTMPTFMEKTIAKLDDDTGFVYTSVIIHYHDKNEASIVYEKHPNIGRMEDIAKFLIENPLTISPGCAIFRRKDALKNLLLQIPNAQGIYGKDSGVGEDLLLFLLTSLDYPKYAHVSEPLACFMSHPGSITVGAHLTGKSQELTDSYTNAKAYYFSLPGSIPPPENFQKLFSYFKTESTIDSQSSFAASIQEVLIDIRPTKIIETGTYLGMGTTTVIAKTLQSIGIEDAVFLSIEVNPGNYARAKEYFEKNNIKVDVLNGLSVPRAMLPSKKQITKTTVTETDYDGIFADHQENDRVELYYNETNFPDVPDDLLYKCLKLLDFRPDFVLLDSGGHMGNIEFNYLVDNLKGLCYIALGNVCHVKHYRSFKQIQSDERFEIVAHSKEKFGFCIARFTPQKTTARTDAKNILWIRTDSISDNVLSSAMLSYIREEFKDAKITVVCQEHIAELYESCPYIDGVVVFNRTRALDDEPYRQEIANQLLMLKPDISLNSVYSREQLTDFFTLKSCAAQRIALDGNLCNISAEIKQKSDQLYTTILPSDGEHKSELERHRDFLRGLGIDTTVLEPVVWISPQDQMWADMLLQKNNLNPDETVVLFAGVQNNCRLYENYGIALSELCQKNQLKVIALGGEQDYDTNQRNLDVIGVATVNLSGKTTLLESAAILKRCRLAVGAETALAHISCAVGTANVILMGGGHFGRFLPYSPLTSIVCLPLDCYGCNWNGCRYERYHCVKNIEPSVLAEALSQTFEHTSQKPRVFYQDTSSWVPQPGRPCWQAFDQFLDTDNIVTIPVNQLPSIVQGAPPHNK